VFTTFHDTNMFMKIFCCLILVVGIHFETSDGQTAETETQSDVFMTETVIDSCDDFGKAVESTLNGDVEILMHPFADIECLNFTTFNLTSGNKLTIHSSENLDNYHGSSSFVNVRLNVQSGSSLTVENNVLFHTPNRDHEDLPDVNGGSFVIGEGSEVRFLNDFKTQFIGVRSQTEESSDFANHQNSGGVIYNLGKFVVTGMANFESCENSGGGESSPGPGGCVYNEGNMLFKSGVEMSDVSITDDEGNNGAGFYNLGTVRVSGKSRFSRMRAETAGAIYNGEGSRFVFREGVSVLFSECTASDGVAGSIFNSGYMKFTGPTLFLEGRSYYQGGAIVVDDTGFTKLSKDSVFYGSLSGDSGAPVHVRSGGVFKFWETKTYFIDNFGDGFDNNCYTVYDENDGCVI